MRRHASRTPVREERDDPPHAPRRGRAQLHPINVKGAQPMKSTHIIALIAAAGLAAPMGALANDPAKHTQATTTTQSTAQPTTKTERAKEAVADSVITTKVKG